MSRPQHKPKICLITPALAAANNGNWQTARRWARMLSGPYSVRLLPRWDGEDADVLIALHARRSAESIQDWATRHPDRPLIVVLTGTDLYRDLACDAEAQRSLEQAHRLIVLQELGNQSLPDAVRGKSLVCFQSAPSRRPQVKTARHLRALMVGHLREEKSPETYFEAVRQLSGQPDMLFDHIGAPLDPALGAMARELSREFPNYRWLDALPHPLTRRRIAGAHVLVHASRIEGGAHVVLEAITSGTPVLASRIDGNVGMLGPDYDGYFAWNDAAGLAAQLLRCRQDAAYIQHLANQCAQRAFLFSPSREQRTLRSIVAQLLEDLS